MYNSQKKQEHGGGGAAVRTVILADRGTPPSICRIDGAGFVLTNLAFRPPTPAIDTAIFIEAHFVFAPTRDFEDSSISHLAYLGIPESSCRIDRVAFDPKVQTYRELYDGNGKLISRTKESFSVYTRRNQVVTVGTKKAEQKKKKTKKTDKKKNKQKQDTDQTAG